MVVVKEKSFLFKEAFVTVLILVINLVNLTRLAALCVKFIDEIITILFYDTKTKRLSLFGDSK